MRDSERLSPTAEDAYFKRLEQDKLIRVFLERLIKQTIPKIKSFNYHMLVDRHA